jgi:hypothetical protein
MGVQILGIDQAARQRQQNRAAKLKVRRNKKND